MVNPVKEAVKRSIPCAFCEGTGKDPFGLLSPLSTCQVCLGRGRVTVLEPAVECAFCGGSGVHRNQRITCTVCRGKGMATIPEPSERCPTCRGRGRAPGDYLPCLPCKGTGLVQGTDRKQPTKRWWGFRSS